MIKSMEGLFVCMAQQCSTGTRSDKPQITKWQSQQEQLQERTRLQDKETPS